MNHFDAFLMCCFWLLLFSLSTVQAKPLLDAKRAYQQGQYEQASHEWQKVLDTTQNPNHRLEALLGIARIHRQLGVYQTANNILQRALPLAQKTSHTTYQALLLNEFSKLHLSQGKKGYQAAIQWGEQALNMARNTNSPLVLGEVLNHWGNLLTVQYDYEGALNTFNEALTHLDTDQKRQHTPITPATLNQELSTLSGKIMINKAQTIWLKEVELAQFVSTPVFNASVAALQTAVAQITQNDWTDAYAQVFGFITLSRLATKIQAQLPKPAPQLTTVAYQTLLKARDLANRLDNAAAKAYAYGYLGQLYEQAQRYSEALHLTRQALFFAQQTRQQLFISYLWQWRIGHILSAQTHHREEAIAAYQQAMNSFQKVRTYVANTGYFSLMETDFRGRIAPIYFELADLLLQQARVAPTVSSREHLLRQAIATIENYREAELQDYFQTDCLNLPTHCPDIEKVLDTQTALLYPILLPNRLELLLQRREGLIQATVPIAEPTLRAAINAFLSPLYQHPNPDELAITRSQRIAAGQQPTAEMCTPALRGGKPQPISTSAQTFSEPAQTLYRWLIKPLLPHLQNINTLVIVPDSTLRRVPFAALHDGQQFLIETVALATLSSLCLNTSAVLPKAQQPILLSGLSKAVQGFAALPCTQYELEAIQTLYDKAPPPLFNETYTLPELHTHIQQNDYAIVHIASHGQFSANLENTFVLTYDDKLNIDKLEQLMRITQLKTKQPVELLTLSACETAVGDERAALGLAGVALKAGAQSVLASLWRVDDEATPAVIIEFYRQLKTPGVSKAQALQNAQNIVLNDKAYVRYQHPYYWAAFSLIGYWQ